MGIYQAFLNREINRRMQHRALHTGFSSAVVPVEKQILKMGAYVMIGGASVVLAP